MLGGALEGLAVARFDPIAQCVELDIDEAAIEAHKARMFRKRLLASDRQEWDTAGIVRAYRELKHVEPLFRTSKNPMHFAITPQSHYTGDKIHVHVFCCLLALAIAGALREELPARGIDLPLDRMMDDLAAVRQAWLTPNLNPGKVAKKRERMDDETGKLWAAIEETGARP
ncbi:MAG: hypothetical protein FWG10_06760 [Eubacteriaceae bacterium]|nr:hypothetical protein [Eubacteriaceae bacterium]